MAKPLNMIRKRVPISIKWFPPSWIQISAQNKLIYIDPAYLKTYFKYYPKRIEIQNVPSFADKLGVKLEVPGMVTLTVDTAYGGDSFVIVDARALGFNIVPDDSWPVGYRLTDTWPKRAS